MHPSRHPQSKIIIAEQQIGRSALKLLLRALPICLRPQLFLLVCLLTLVVHHDERDG